MAAVQRQSLLRQHRNARRNRKEKLMKKSSFAAFAAAAVCAAALSSESQAEAQNSQTALTTGAFTSLERGIHIHSIYHPCTKDGKTVNAAVNLRIELDNISAKPLITQADMDMVTAAYEQNLMPAISDFLQARFAMTDSSALANFFDRKDPLVDDSYPGTKDPAMRAKLDLTKTALREGYENFAKTFVHAVLTQPRPDDFERLNPEFPSTISSGGYSCTPKP